ncbi:hypothetical protein MMC20_001060 [Loxospora ochrophaea]|nr:hypothetical protein [Loxospora ochrophaea]
MHSTLVRVQNVFGFFTTVAFFLAAAIALSVVLSPQAPSADIELRNVQVVKGRPHYYSSKKEEYAHVKFDLEADFTSLFNWNTKQLFVYVLATYPSSSGSSHPPSSAIIWDTIIPSTSQLHPFNPLTFFTSPENQNSKKKPKPKPKPKKASSTPFHSDTKPGLLSLPNAKPKYQITDITGKLASQENVTLEVGWNIQPWVGAQTWTIPEGKGWGRWAGVRGGRSRLFEMPALKGKKEEGKERVVGERVKPEAAGAKPAVDV